MGFGKVLRTLRTTAGLSLREVARDLDVSPTYLSLIETGKIPPPVEEKIHRLEDRLGVPEGYLLSFTERSPRQVSEMLSGRQEAVRFFAKAHEAGFESDDFILMTQLITQGGREAFVQTLKQKWKELRNKEPAEGTGDAPSLLEERFVFPCVEAESWYDLIESVSRRIEEIQPGIDAEAVADALVRRETSGSTALGNGLAVPHAMVEGLPERIVALARVPGGVDFGARDKKPVDLAVFILGSEAVRASHIQDLARIARLFLQPGFKERIMEARDAGKIFEEFRKGEETIP